MTYPDHDESDCSEAIHRLYHFLDGELNDDTRAAIRHHLDDCSPCLDAFDFEAELRIVIATRCREEVPPALRARIAAAIHLAEGSVQPGADLE